MGIATLVALARGLRTAAVLALVFFGGRWILRRYGDAARAAFDQWVDRTQPRAGDLVRAFLQPGAGLRGADLHH
jgi:hypothetical protein